MAPVRAAVGVVVLVLAFLGGLWVGLGGGGDASSTQPGPPAVETGGIRYAVLGWRCGILAVQGDHADWLPEGQYCRVRLRMTSADRHVHTFTAAQQTLILDDGSRSPANVNAVQIQDQPTSDVARPFATLEFDVWFDIAADAQPVAIELFGESDTQGARVDLAAQ